MSDARLECEAAQARPRLSSDESESSVQFEGGHGCDGGDTVDAVDGDGDGGDASNGVGVEGERGVEVEVEVTQSTIAASKEKEGGAEKGDSENKTHPVPGGASDGAP